MTKNYLLYLIAWKGPEIPEEWLENEHFEVLLAENLVEKTEKGPVATQKGRGSLSSDARRACLRPTDYYELGGRQQWDVDKGLRILDWDGT